MFSRRGHFDENKKNNKTASSDLALCCVFGGMTLLLFPPLFPVLPFLSIFLKADGRADGRTVGRTDGRSDSRLVGRTHGRLEQQSVRLKKRILFVLDHGGDTGNGPTTRGPLCPFYCFC